MKHLYLLILILVTNSNISTAQNITMNPISAIGMCDGSATLYNSANLTSWNWTWYDANNTVIATSQVVSNLCAGNYSLVVDSSGTEITFSFSMENPNPCANFSLYTAITNPSPGNCDGIVECFPIGGTAPYSYQMSGFPQQSSPIFSNLCNTYNNPACIDANGCMVTTPVVISVTNPILINLTTTGDLTSNCIGEAFVTATGGTGIYSYLWSTGETTNAIGNLCVGNYSVVVWDSTDTVTTNFTIINPCTNFTGNLTTTGTINGNCNGTITATLSGGSPGYQYSLDNGLTFTPVATFTSLCPGTYDFIGTDVNGCLISLPITISDSTITINLLANLTSTDDLTNNCSGSASVSPNGGIAPYTVLWSNGSTAGSVSNLCAGIYSVTIWDAGSDSTTVNFVIADSSSTYNNNPYPNGPINDTLYTDLVTNCIIDYNAIDSAALYQAVYSSSSQSLYVTWAIYSPTDTVYINDTLAFTGNPGYYNLMITVYCPNKSGNDLLKIEQVIYFDGTAIYFSTLGVDEHALENVSIYPNPFSSSISVDNKDGLIQSMKLVDLNGRVLSEMSSVNSGMVKMEQLEFISSGTYLLILSGENSSRTVKVIK